MNDAPMSRMRAVIFDLDDTLYSERQYVLSGFSAVASAFAHQLGAATSVCREMTEIFDADRTAKVFDRMLEQRCIQDPNNMLQAMLTCYRRHVPDIELFPDADAALTRHRDQFKLGIISDGRMISQALKLKALRLRDRIHKVIITGELGPGFEKPHPRAFEWMSSSLEVSPQECAYVADNATKDFIAPNALGWCTIQIVRSDGLYRSEAPTESARPQHIITTLNDLDDLLE